MVHWNDSRCLHHLLMPLNFSITYSPKKDNEDWVVNFTVVDTCIPHNALTAKEGCPSRLLTLSSQMAGDSNASV